MLLQDEVHSFLHEVLFKQVFMRQALYAYIVDAALIAGVKVCLTMKIMSIFCFGFLSDATQPNDVLSNLKLICTVQKTKNHVACSLNSATAAGKTDLYGQWVAYSFGLQHNTAT